MDMEEILEALKQQDGYVEPVMEKTFEELGDFQFALDKDDKGLRLQDPSYVKKNCKNCYGRGGVVQSIGGRHWVACGCLVKGYRKARRSFDETEAFYKKIEEQDKLVSDIVAQRKAQLEAAGK